MLTFLASTNKLKADVSVWKFCLSYLAILSGFLFISIQLQNLFNSYYYGSSDVMADGE